MKNKYFEWNPEKESPKVLAAHKICEMLQMKGFKSYFVGGWVRNRFLNLENFSQDEDIDICTSANPQELKKIFPQLKFHGEAFGVCRVQAGDFQIEVATFRREGNYSNKRQPDFVVAGTFEDDSARRDFTVNCIYFEPILNKIIDPYDGVEDIENKILRCVGNSKQRLEEDLLRVLRLFRFAANLQFNIEEDTFFSAQSVFSELSGLTPERVSMELKKIKQGSFCSFVKFFVTDYLKNKQKLETSLNLKFSNSFHTRYPFTALYFAKCGLEKLLGEFNFPFQTSALEKNDKALQEFAKWIFEEMWPDPFELFQKVKKHRHLICEDVLAVLENFAPQEKWLLNILSLNPEKLVSEALVNSCSDVEYTRTIFSIRGVLKAHAEKIGKMEEKFQFFYLCFGLVEAKKLLVDLIVGEGFHLEETFQN